MKTFTDLIGEVGMWDVEFFEMGSAPVERFDVKKNALIFDKNSIPLDQDTRVRLLAKAGAPVFYLAKRSIDIQILALREHIELAASKS